MTAAIQTAEGLLLLGGMAVGFAAVGVFLIGVVVVAKRRRGRR